MNLASLIGTLTDFGTSSVAAALPIILAAMGGLFTESAGSLSVALEGAMLAGAFTAVGVATATGSTLLAMGAALTAGLFVGALLGQVSTRLKADVFVAGLAVNLLVPALVSLLSSALFGTQGVVNLPQGVAGHALSSDGSTALALFFACLLLWATHDLTPLGLRLRAAGERGEAARAAGLDRDGLRRLAHLVAGAASGLAGSWLALSVAAFVPGMSAGRGWIALVAIYLGGRRPLGILGASLGFGLLLSLSNRAQSVALVPPELLPALPYLVTLAAYLVSQWRKSRPKV
ncbi:MAG TPA: ABC transporter permease [Rectinemataceae bacterium]|nr:ABC transporter permease [Rectinemataceae bacterium]